MSREGLTVAGIASKLQALHVRVSGVAVNAKTTANFVHWSFTENQKLVKDIGIHSFLLRPNPNLYFSIGWILSISPPSFIG